jgi:hypothetical protein
MRKRFAAASVPVALLASLLVTTSFPAIAADSLGESFTQGKFGYSFRWRLENVDQDPLPHDATAIPLRARINFHTADLYGFSAKAEFDYVFNFGVETFNAGGGNTPNPPGYPVIADPGGEDLNQLFLQYKAKFGGQFRIGRQRIIYDNARFVGNVGWRQNEQTYDSFSFGHKTGNGWNFQYAYVDNVNRIFGDEVNSGDHAQSTNLFNIAYDIKNVGKLTGYYYDIDNEDVANLSNKTLGLRMSGKFGNDGPAIGYTLEYAHQTDNADNPVDYKADYWRGDLSVGFNWATVYIGYESLGGSDSEPGQAFRTPLATLHAFNGWADKFLNTPHAGLNDAFIGAKGKLGHWIWNMLYHNFTAQSGSADYGSEIDGSIARKFKENYGVLFKLASFKTDSPAYGDTTKLWVQLTADFK